MGKTLAEAWRSVGSPTPDKAVWGLETSHVPVWRKGDLPKAEKVLVLTTSLASCDFQNRVATVALIVRTCFSIPIPTWQSSAPEAEGHRSNRRREKSPNSLSDQWFLRLTKRALTRNELHILHTFARIITSSLTLL